MRTTIQVLMGVALLSLVMMFGLTAPSAHAQAEDAKSFKCGVDFIHYDIIRPVPAGGLQPQEAPVDDQRLTGINLIVGPTLAANADALAAFNRAADTWVSWFMDAGVVVDIEADLVPLSGNILGQASSSSYLWDYDEGRDSMIADASVDESICNLLPTATQFNNSVVRPPGCDFNDEMGFTKANMRALGWNVSTWPGSDAVIEFNSNKLADFDFNRQDGIGSNQLDFEGVVLHEIGHVLGFTSCVGTIDSWVASGGTVEVQPRPLDLFRLDPGAGAINFTTAGRLMIPGNTLPANPPGGPSHPNQAVHCGIHDHLMSTGRNLGDGQQPSHWKDDNISGDYQGLMDPTLSRGQQVKPLEQDIWALGVSGWDLGSGPCGGGVQGDVNLDGIPWTAADLVAMIQHLVAGGAVTDHFRYSYDYSDNPFFPCQPTYSDALFFTFYFVHGWNAVNHEPWWTEFPEPSDVSVQMPSQIPLIIGTTAYTVRLRNSSATDMRIYQISLPIEFVTTGGTISGSFVYTNFRTHPSSPDWTCNTQWVSATGDKAMVFGGNSSGFVISSGTTADLFDVEFTLNGIGGNPTVNCTTFAEPAAWIPEIVCITTPKMANGDKDFVPPTTGTLTVVQVPSYCCSLRGDVDSDGLGPNIADLVYLVTYMFQDGDEPECIGNTDVDGDGIGPNIADLVYLVTYMFQDGPPLAPCL